LLACRTPKFTTIIRRATSALAGLAFFGISQFVWCAEISLQWDLPNDPEGLVAGYQVRYGIASGVYTETWDVEREDTTTTTVPNLQSGTRYYFAVRSRNGDASDFSVLSNEVNAVAGTPDTIPPTVTSTTPADGASNVSVTVSLTATFDEPIDPATLDSGSFELRNAGNNLVAATVTYDAPTRTVTLDPTAPLASGSLYTATLKGGATGVKDLAGNALAVDFTWSLTTAPQGSGPCATPCSLWDAAVTPSLVTESDSSAVELGVKFQSDVDGSVTGVRFYKGPQNTGTHVGSLWSSTGQSLAQATFTGETASGWQQVDFAEPVAIQANTLYLVSYHTEVGRYSQDVGYFASAYTNGPLRAPADGENGGNGVYLYGSGGFPNQTWNASNYWVDVVFTTETGPDTNQPPVVKNPGHQYGTEGVWASLEIDATDPDTDALTYSAAGLPEGLSVNFYSGIISGAPQSAGNYVVTVSVSDGKELVDTSFNWLVSAANRPPVVSSPGAQFGLRGDTIKLGIAASDPDGDTLTYSATGLPSGLVIDAERGDVSGVLNVAGVYSVTITVFDGSEKSHASFEWVVDIPPTIRAEAGVIRNVTNSEWTPVTLDYDYHSMVVVTTPRYSPDVVPQMVRVRNASGNGFELRMARADEGAGEVSADVDYLVVEEGVYDAAVHGVTMEAVKYTSAVTDAKGSWVGTPQRYANSYTSPVVIGQVMSANDSLPCSFWARGSSRSNPPDSSTLYTGKTVLEDPERLRVNELVGYVVFEAGIGTLGNRMFEAGVGEDTVRGMGNNPFYEYPHGAQLSVEVALLSMAAMDGNDGAWPVLSENQDSPGTKIQLAVDEDQLSDPETSHTTEQIAYVVFGRAEVADNQAPLVTTPASIGTQEGATVSLQIEAVDPDGDEVSYSASNLPPGLSIDAGTGLIEGNIGAGARGVYDVTVEVDDGTSITGVAFQIAVAEDVAGIRAQIGVVEAVSSEEWATVELADIYASMVVVTTPSYTKNDPPAVVQIENAFGNSFDVRMVRRDSGLDPITADVHFLVVEEGVYNAAEHGVTLEAVKYVSTVTDAAGSWIGENRSYANFYANPVVVGQVMSVSDDAPTSFWTCGASVTEPPSAIDLTTGKTVAEDPNPDRADETIGYVVLEAGTGNGKLSGLGFAAGIGADTIVGMSNQATPVSYWLSGIGSTSVAIATLAGMDGGNGGWAVLHGPLDPSGTSLALGVDEDQLGDSERSHTTEQIGYIVFE
jgi:hypothetical protein